MEEDLQPRRDEGVFVYCLTAPGAQFLTASGTPGVGAEAGEVPDQCCAVWNNGAGDCGSALGERGLCQEPLC
eukprot:13500686-Alexandrium_andersonii.AAC.1